MSGKTQEDLDNLVVEGLNAERGELDLRERELDDDDMRVKFKFKRGYNLENYGDASKRTILREILVNP